MARSANGLNSFALGRVVINRSCVISDVQRLRSKAIRCSVFRPSFLWATLCRISTPLNSMTLVRQEDEHSALARSYLIDEPSLLIELHPEMQPHRGEDFLDLVQRFASEVFGLEHVRLGLLDKLTDGSNIGVLKTVVRAHR